LRVYVLEQIQIGPFATSSITNRPVYPPSQTVQYIGETCNHIFVRAMTCTQQLCSPTPSLHWSQIYPYAPPFPMLVTPCNPQNQSPPLYFPALTSAPRPKPMHHAEYNIGISTRFTEDKLQNIQSTLLLIRSWSSRWSRYA
jgi:hypothetical protein